MWVAGLTQVAAGITQGPRGSVSAATGAVREPSPGGALYSVSTIHRMRYLVDAGAVIILSMILAAIKDRWTLSAKRARAATQLESFIADWVNGRASLDLGQFEKTKQSLMWDWLEAHPQCTRVDFARYFDQMVDGHCETGAIEEYFKRREVYFANHPRSQCSA